jgi:iron complex outermembrane receptor protein
MPGHPLRTHACALLVAGAAVLAPPALAATLRGRVVDAAGQPVPVAQITVLEVGRSTLTDDAGDYAFTDLPGGAYRVALQRLGFAPQVRAVHVGTADATLDFRLAISLVEIAPVQVTASATATTPLTSPQPVSVLDDEALRTARAATLGETVRQLAGVRSWSTGGGIGKPVIRGLRSDRVLVLADGARLESQGWGDEHGPNVDLEDVARIEIIRGPASVLYGSDALGGVVNLIPRDLPSAFGRRPFVRGRLAGGYVGNGRAPLGHAGVEGARGGLGFRGSLSGRTSEDRSSPGGVLFNSGDDAVSWAGELGARGSWGTLQGGLGATRETVEIHEDPAADPAATPYQHITDRTARVKALLPLGGTAHLDLVATHQRNERREFEARGDDDYALGLLARTWSGDVRFHHAPVGRLHGLVGVSGLVTGFDKSGPESLIPGSTTGNLALYVFEQLERERVHLSFGARYDRRHLEVEDDAELAVTAQERVWNALSGNIGALVRIGPSAAVALNLGRGFRAPSTFDLFSNGVHEGTVAYEVGDPALDTEKSFNTDLSWRIQSGRLSAEVTGYVNRIEDFIHSRPTGAVDPASGFQVFQVTQGDARLIGAEASARWHPTGGLHLHLAADHVRGDNTSTDTPLPWIPPFRAVYGVRLEGARAGSGLADPYLDLTAESNAAQDRLDPFDTPTGAYTLLHLGAGFAVPNDGRPLRVDAGARNLLDTTCRDFMSRFKAYADAPGRSLWIRLTSSF